MASSLHREVPRRAETTALRPEPAADEGELARVDREAEHEMQRSRRRMWLTRLLGLGGGSVLVTWAALGPNLDQGTQLIFGLLVATVATVIGFALAIYSRRTHVGAVEQYLDQLRGLAERLQRISERDSLTGLYHHGYLLRRLEQEITPAQRHQRSLSVVILDLDAFKEVNDRHGHLVGDEVLQLIAGAIQRQIRQHDVVARYGGDEFCLVLPETDRAGAAGLVEKLREAVVVLPGPPEGWSGNAISFGCGCSTYPEDGTTVRALIAAADAQLYQEKQSQRLKRAQESRATVRENGRRPAGRPSGPAEELPTAS